MSMSNITLGVMWIWRLTLYTKTGGIALFICKSPEIKVYSCFMHGKLDTTKGNVGEYIWDSEKSCDYELCVTGKT